MDPMTMMRLMQQQGMNIPGGFSGPAPQGMPQQDAQLPSFQPDPNQPPPQGHHHGGLNPLMLLSPLGGLFASSPKTALSLMSPAFGLANILGAFK